MMNSVQKQKSIIYLWINNMTGLPLQKVRENFVLIRSKKLKIQDSEEPSGTDLKTDLSNKALEPIAARWATPAQLFVRQRQP